MGMPPYHQGWLEGAHVLGEDQVQLRFAESERPVRWQKEVAGRWARSSRDRPGLGGDLGLGRYLKS